MSWSKTKEDFLLHGEEDVSIFSTLENGGICLLILRTIASYQDPCCRSTAQATHKVNSPLTYPKSYRNIISSKHSLHPRNLSIYLLDWEECFLFMLWLQYLKAITFLSRNPATFDHMMCPSHALFTDTSPTHEPVQSLRQKLQRLSYVDMNQFKKKNCFKFIFRKFKTQIKFDLG